MTKDSFFKCCNHCSFGHTTVLFQYTKFQYRFIWLVCDTSWFFFPLRTVIWDKNNITAQGFQDIAVALEK